MQGKDLAPVFDNPSHSVRDAAFSVNGKGFLLREDRWAYIEYGKNGSKGTALFDMEKDPSQFTNLAERPAHRKTAARLKAKLKEKLATVRENDLGHKD